jgi:hypothetical protein
MANTVNGLLTTYGRTALVEILYAATGTSIVGGTSANAYAFIGKSDSWPDNANPPKPTQDQASIKQIFKNIIAAKRILTSSTSPVVPRYDWTSGDAYVQYTDYQDMFVFDNNGIMDNIFYVRNSYDQIFKCLYNNNGADSTVEPKIEPGSTNIGQVIVTSDGYKWIYVTTIDKGLKKLFFDNQWMPVSVGKVTPNPLVTAGFGSIDAINITANGSNYPTNTVTRVVITGDGQGAIATANAYNGIIKSIIVSNAGNNYTYATVSIVSESANGTGATANAVISPIGGHGYDPISELGCNHIMITAEFDNSESTIISSGKSGQPYLPTGTTFGQVGILVNPLDSTGNSASEIVYNACDIAAVTTGASSYTSGETVSQGSTFTAKVVTHDTSNNLVSLINTIGTYALGQPLVGGTSGTSRIMLQYSPSLFNKGSGYMMYVENRSPVQRNPNGNEQIRLVLRF